MRRLCSLLGMPQNRFASIHVVGTNGKTSVTRMTAALLEAHGVPAGAYLSPHITSWRERILIRGEPISEEAFAAALERAEQAAQVADRSAGDEGPVTQFELLTAAAFVAFAAARVQYAVIEAGLGGRLDATNVIPSKLTVLTSVGFDHTEWLGETLEEIAAEKLAVLRDHTTLIGRTGPASRSSEVIEREVGREARERSSGQRASRTTCVPGYQGQEPRTCTGRSTDRSWESSIPLPWSSSSSGSRRGSSRSGDAPSWSRAIPPRSSTPRTTPTARMALAEALPDLARGREVVCCLAVLEGKDATGIVDGLAPACSRFVCTEIPPESDRGIRAARRAGTARAGAGRPLRQGRGAGGGDRRPDRGLGASTRACQSAEWGRAGGRQPLPSQLHMDREARSELLTMMGLVAIVVAVVILVFFAFGYVFGLLFL